MLEGNTHHQTLVKLCLSFAFWAPPVWGSEHPLLRTGEGKYTDIPPIYNILGLTVSASSGSSLGVTDAEARKLGQKGGRANTPEQRAARRLNAYRTLAQRYPTSVKIQQKLERLEKEQNELP